MYLGTQFAARTDADYETFKQLGVNHINGFPEIGHQNWTSSNLKEYKEKVESYDLKLDMVQLPLSSADLDTRAKNGEFYNILTGKSPDRDIEIERICELIQMCSEAEIPAVKYNLNIIGIPRTDSELGRGGAKLSTFRWDNADKNSPETIAGNVSEDIFWERIEYFLDKVVPVAEQNKVRLACHPHDPYTPPGFKGVTRVLGTVEGLKKFISIKENKFHGLNFCQGTITEMMENPGEEIFDVIRYFGKKNKIFNVHFRNIRGSKLSFTEVFPDEGSINMYEAIKVYKEVNYQYMLMPDHVPQINAKDPKMTAFAYCYGYINALLQTIDEI
tara:strand:+ start:3040 stop:4029 length:990 start_codon:yes stop_codon:yes gene_type:complete